MRVFIAVDLPHAVQRALGEIKRELAPTTRSARWVPPESIHITLKFLGEVAEEQIGEIDRALAGLNWEPFAVTVRGLGFFPDTGFPRVFWAGMEAPRLQELAAEVEARLERLGFQRERRAFQPHVTVARAREARIEASLVTAASKYAGRGFGVFTVDRVCLFRSTLKPSGPIYSKLREYALEPSAGRNSSL